MNSRIVTGFAPLFLLQTEDKFMFVSLPCTTPALQFTIKGHILTSEGLQELVCSDGTCLRVVPQLQYYCSGQRRWQVIPTTDSTGVIVNVEVVDSRSSTALEPLDQDQCQLVGRVIQLSKRQNRVLFKVTRPGAKTLKLTLLNADSRMQVSQLWSCTAIRVGCGLQITEATPPDAQLDSSTTAPAPVLSVHTTVDELENASQLVSFDPSTPSAIAIEALWRKTGVTGWQLKSERQRARRWEWEALNPERGLHARVKVSEDLQFSSVYQYPPTPESARQKKVLSLADGGALNELGRERNTIAYEAHDRLVVTPLGGAMGIEANCFIVGIGPYELVLDCGTRSQGHNPLPALEYLKHSDLLLLSHAHLNHIGAVPVFHSRWPKTRMVCTPGTREIAHVTLLDGLKEKQSNQGSKTLFDQAELSQTLLHLETYPVGQDFEPLPGLKVRFINAGHVVGAACIYLRYGKRSLLYTGNYNTTSSRTTSGLSLKDLPQADILLTEGTNGASTNPARKTQEAELLNEIASVVQAGGSVLIPSSPLGRAQDILLAMRTSSLFQQLKIPIYVDGMVRAVTDILSSNLDLLPTSVQNLVKQSGMKPFFNQNSNQPIIPITPALERSLTMQKPSIIIADSDMFSDGASASYAKTLLSREHAAIFILGCADEESPERWLQNLKTGDKIELDGSNVTVRAQIKRFNLSIHADKIGLTQVINIVNPLHLILIHGAQSTLKSLARSGNLHSKHYIHIPLVGEEITFGQRPVNATTKQVAVLEASQEFEVEVSAEVEGAWIRIPESVVEQDPRWQMLAGNGVMKAKWDGINLKLSPTDNQDLAIESARASGIDCCAKCQNFSTNTSQCNSPDSPLSGLSVDPSGYCLEYNA